MNKNIIKTNTAKTCAVCLALAIPFTMLGCNNKTDAAAFEPAYETMNTTFAPTLGVTKDAGYDAEYEYLDTFEEAAPADGEVQNGGDSQTSDPNAVITENEATAVTSRKLITTINVTLETENFDEMMAALKSELAKVGGYIENEYTYNGSTYDEEAERYTSIRVRVPDDCKDAFVSGVSGNGNLVSKTTETKDVTLSYVDTQGKKDMYLAEEKSLLELLEKAETIEDISYLVSRLSEVRYNIETMESTLRTYDDLVDYATINFDIREVKVYTPTVEKPQTTKEKLAQQFNENLTDVLESFRDFGVGIVANSPYIVRFLVISGVIVGACFLIIKGVVKKIKKKAAARKALKKAASKTEE